MKTIDENAMKMWDKSFPHYKRQWRKLVKLQHEMGQKQFLSHGSSTSGSTKRKGWIYP